MGQSHTAKKGLASLKTSEIKVFESSKKVTIDETSDGVVCQTKEGKIFLPGTLDDYKMVTQAKTWKIFIDREEAETMRNKTQKSILKKKAEKEEAEKNNKAGAPHDPKKAVVVKNIQKIIDDYQRVINCIEEEIYANDASLEELKANSKGILLDHILLLLNLYNFICHISLPNL